MPGLINVDFADVRSIMHQAGNSHMASGVGVGEGRAEAAALAAIESPLLESSINSATGVVWNITGPMDLTIAEVDAAAALICGCVDENANIIFGAVLDPDMHEEVRCALMHRLPCLPRERTVPASNSMFAQGCVRVSAGGDALHCPGGARNALCRS